MDSRERVLTSLKLGKPDRVPFMEWFYNIEIGEGILGKKEYDKGEIAEALCMDGIGVNLMPTFYAHREYSESGQKYETGGMIKTPEDLKMVQLADPKDASIYDPIKRTLEKYGSKFAMFVGTSIGIDGMFRGLGYEGFAYAMADYPELVDNLLEIYTDWACEVAIQVQKLGIDILWYADDIAFNTSLMVSPDFFLEKLKPRMKRVLDLVKIPKIYHSDGCLMPVMEDIIELGFNGLHPLDPGGMDIELVKQMYGSRICLIGNIDLRYTLVNGTVEEVKAEVKDRIEKIGYNGGYILASASSLTPYCKTENILAMRDALLEYGHI